ncbi:MAG: outer membrane beta-barrel protein [Bacteroidaceae bacterium]|nr:outer membrane beta-barrel protein [Bacteroidaceae bacterium]
MKRTLLTALVLLTSTLGASAQFYAGGRLGWWRDGDTHHKRFTIQPEVGYQWNEELTFGALFGYYNDRSPRVKENPLPGDDATTTRSFELSPYVRYTALQAGPVELFTDFTVGFATSKTTAQQSRNSFRVGFRPGVSVALGKSFYAVAHTGFLGYADSEVGLYRDGFGFDISRNDLTFGIFYRF